MDNIGFFIIFNIVILSFVIFDFALLSKNDSMKRALSLSFLWVFLGISFSFVIYILFGLDRSYEYLAAYFVEKSLSIDNIFVFLVIFDSLGIEKRYQRKLLFLGIWSALILRIIMIFAISSVLSSFHFAIYIFGAMVFYMGIVTLFKHDGQNIGSVFLSKIKKYVHVYEGNHNGRFFVTENGVRKITILVLGILCIEVCDIIFAFDSIPAIFSITNDKTIIYTSNAFAIIGLRSLYITFKGIADKFFYVKYAVGVLLCIIGVKMIISDYIHIKPSTSLIIISTVLLFAFIGSEIRSHLIKRRLK